MFDVWFLLSSLRYQAGMERGKCTLTVPFEFRAGFYVVGLVGPHTLANLCIGYGEFV